MRILVDGAGVRQSVRMRSAALGLALRGHRVFWHGDGFEDARAAAGVEPAPAGLALSRAHAQLVVSAGPPARAALLGWLGGAHVLVASVGREELRRWSPFDRLGWQSLHSFALVEERDAENVSAAPGPLELARVGVWSSEPDDVTPGPEPLDVEILERAAERSLARHRAGSPRPAVFLDRDGTLVVEVGYLADPASLELLPGVAPALRTMQAAGYALVVISNQAGVGRGMFPMRRVHEVMARLRLLLRREGVELDAIYFCPHHPDAGCACRKPGTELIERAADDLLLDVRHSAMVGDKGLDVETGQRAGARGLLVRTGYGEEESRRLAAGAATRPDLVAADLPEAARWLADHAVGH